MNTNIILQGDCLTELKKLPDESINCCMTSPPYWALRDYGTASWEGGSIECDHKIPEIEKDPKNPEAGSHIARFNRESCYKCGAKRVDKQLGLEPTFQEYINKLCDIFDGVKRVLRKDGTCWVNIGDSYSATRWTGEGKGQPMNKFKDGHRDINPNKESGLPDKNLVLIPFRFAIEMQKRGWIIRNTIIWHKPQCMPSPTKDRFTVDFEYLFLFSKNPKYYFETQYEPLAKSSLKDNRLDKKPTKGVGKTEQGKYAMQHCGSLNSIGRIKRTVWRINPKGFREAHFATYPEELCYTPIKAGCPEGGIVLDPFFGAGTTGLVALKQNKKFIGIELNPKYIEIAMNRLKPFMEQERL